MNNSMTESEESGQVVYTKPVLEFTTVANEVSKFLEAPSSTDVQPLLTTLQKVLPFLYMKATLLPDTELLFDDGNEKFVTEEDWNSIKDRMQSIIGRHDNYPETVTDEGQTDEMRIASISENLADIYQDLKDYCTLFQVGAVEIMNDALWEVKHNFQQYWGIKVLSTLAAIHKLLAMPEEYFAQEEESDDERDTSEWFIAKRQEEFRKSLDE